MFYYPTLFLLPLRFNSLNPVYRSNSLYTFYEALYIALYIIYDSFNSLINLNSQTSKIVYLTTNIEPRKAIVTQACHSRLG